MAARLSAPGWPVSTRLARSICFLHTYACNRGSGQGGQATWLRSTPLNYWTTPPSQVYSILKAISTNADTSVASTLCPNLINIDAFPGTRTRAAAYCLQDNQFSEFQGLTLRSDKPDSYNANSPSQHCRTRRLTQDNFLTPSPHPRGTSPSLHSFRKQDGGSGDPPMTIAAP